MRQALLYIVVPQLVSLTAIAFATGNYIQLQHSTEVAGAWEYTVIFTEALLGVISMTIAMIAAIRGTLGLRVRHSATASTPAHNLQHIGDLAEQCVDDGDTTGLSLLANLHAHFFQRHYAVSPKRTSTGS